ncbi:hypothetical protein E5S69_29550 [Cupriavidus necator]|uniref:hypothetical protein n=1 Tax=Cupriavidus necator TaxID=106590 RepID=UPI0014903992|nr:hypothetical protein [Cupriavidus necator]NOV27636.1 hypothetical protein [Cupriavidus necator]
MRAHLAAAGLCCAVTCAHAQVTAATAPPTPPAEEAPAWSFLLSGYWNMPRSDSDYGSGIITADHNGKLHLEARINYEARHSQSAFVGWSFSGGETIKVKATPIIGFVTGGAHGPIPGLEVSVAIGKFDYYVEAEYLVGTGDTSAYTYTWSELGFRPVEWLRLGVVAQHTRIYGGDREFQRGGFVQLTYKKYTGGVYWFNPTSPEQVVIASLAIAF